MSRWMNLHIVFFRLSETYWGNVNPIGKASFLCLLSFSTTLPKLSNELVMIVQFH